MLFHKCPVLVQDIVLCMSMFSTLLDSYCDLTLELTCGNKGIGCGVDLHDAYRLPILQVGKVQQQ